MSGWLTVSHTCLPCLPGVFLSTWCLVAILEGFICCWEEGELGKWESSELGRWERCMSGVRWQGGKGGRIVSWHSWRGEKVARWQFGKGGRGRGWGGEGEDGAVRWQGGKME